VVFKRRDRRPIWKIVFETVWPKGGWARAFYYIRHRLHRLPDPPHRIARGIFAGVCVTFSPFFGLHFFLAAGMAVLLRGNVVASLLATFVGNPLTFVPIATLAFQTGNLVLGRFGAGAFDGSIGQTFVDAWGDLKHNARAVFTDARADWDKLQVFYDEVFFPYMVGGFITGPVAGLVFYYLSLPVIQAYQNRRKGRLKAKLMSLRGKASGKADAQENHE
jgi:uncharacterized protein (DUF2062 family)